MIWDDHALYRTSREAGREAEVESGCSLETKKKKKLGGEKRDSTT